MKRHNILFLLSILCSVLVAQPAHANDRPGTEPETPWACPTSHPIKGYASAESGRRVYYLPGSRFYEEASPERCYASEEEARRDGSHPAREQLPPRVRDLVRHDSDARPLAGVAPRV